MKRYGIAGLLLFICMLGVGCTAATKEMEQAQELIGSLSEAAEKIAEGEVLEPAEQDGASAGRQESGHSGEAQPAEPDFAAPYRAQPETGYAYTKLTEPEQTLYREILSGLRSCGTEVAVTTTGEEEFGRVFQCVMNDHPEIFYVDGYTLIRHMKGDTLEGNSFSGSYLYTPEEIEERTGQIRRKAEEILAGAPVGDTYAQVKYIYEYLIDHTEYQLGAADNQNICSVLLNGSSVCQGYAKAAQYLLYQLGIDSVFVSGRVSSGEDHAWNIVCVDGSYYHMDVTWGDASYVAQGAPEEYQERLPDRNYEYLCVPDERLLKTHTPISEIPLPVCDSMEANYYVREGAYFTAVDLDKAAALFHRAYEEGTDYVTFQCADEEIYQEMQEQLIVQQKIFACLQPANGSVAYAVNEQQLALSFWL